MSYDYREAMKLENQLCFPLYAAARSIVNLYTPHLKEIGLTYTQYIVFLVLWEKDGVPVGEICDRLMLDNGTLSPLLKKMEHEGYLKRERSKDDERIVTVTLTKEGRELQKKAKDIPLKVGSCIRIAPDKAKTLHTILHEIMQIEDSVDK